MEFWPEFLASSWGREFLAGGFGGMAGVISGHPFDTLRIRLQQPRAGGGISATTLLRRIVQTEGPSALYRGMTAPLATVALQNAVVFQLYALLARARDESGGPRSYKTIAMAGFGTGVLQSLTLTPIELVKIRLQLQMQSEMSPWRMAKEILKREGVPGLYRGLCITMLRDAPAHGVYFWMYEFAREKLRPGRREIGDESLGTMLVAGGLAGVASWSLCYPPDVIKSRLQGYHYSGHRYGGIVDCFRRSVKEEGYSVLWRGLSTAILRAFVVNGAIFAAYELALRVMPTGGRSYIRIAAEET